MRKKTWLIGMIGSSVILLAVFVIKSDAIFQRGNPLPYLISAIQISDAEPFVEVGEGEGIYISKRGECPELLEYVQDTKGVEFVEQAGSGYLFTDGNENLTVSSEIYWGRYTVWSVPIG